ncbi:hypothetical protein Tco_1068548 [Tanacetum coccineum]|uniref:Uncharacterized protein n=1 Tax=Tanacetum coccineum TaxID=301880 RepID=A0ABQ5HHG9_9ASTR
MEAMMEERRIFKCWIYNHTTNGHQFTMSNRHQELASPEQTASGKDFSNPLMADSLPKTIWKLREMLQDLRKIMMLVKHGLLSVTIVRGRAYGKAVHSAKEAKEFGMVQGKDVVDHGVTDVQDTQTTITHNVAFQTDDLDSYDSDCDDISLAKAILMANLSSYDSDVLSEIPSQTFCPSKLLPPCHNNFDESQLQSKPILLNTPAAPS